MPRTVSATLPLPLAEFVEQQVASGNYGSPEEVIDAGLRLLQEQEERVRTLRDALIEGERSGPATRFDFDEFLASKRRMAR